MRAVITGTGAYYPTEINRNEEWWDHIFIDNDGVPLGKTDRNTVCNVCKLEEIAGIKQRRTHL